MIGGLFKTSSRLALVTVAGFLAGSVSAQAADLGGDCCADLEERVAELEATTVRKGNRKVSLQLSGQVHQSILFWDDGVEKNAYYGVNSINSSSRFRFIGSAKISPDWSAGYYYEMETNNDANSSALNQIKATDTGDKTLVTRHQAFWIESKSMGRVWLGLTDSASAGLNGIDLSGTIAVSNQKPSLLMGGFIVRNSAGALLKGVAASPTAAAAAVTGAAPGVAAADLTWANLMGQNGMSTGLGETTRYNVIKYVSPTVAGFIFSAAYGEDDFWDVALRYAGEFSGFKLAAGIGYAQTTDENGSQWSNCASHAVNKNRDCSTINAGASIMHVATGLFVSGHYATLDDNNLLAGGGRKSDDFDWHVKGGIQQNWTGLGKTTLYGEYMNHQGSVKPDQTAAGGVKNIPLLGGATVTAADVTVWGLGITQDIDAAAMQLYLGYRNHSADVTLNDGNPLAVKDFSLVTAGGIIKF